MKKRSKIILGMCILLLTICIVQAAVNTYFGNVNTELEVKQPITIDDNPASKPIEHKFKLFGGATEKVKHEIINDGEINANISQQTTGIKEGINFTMTWTNGTITTFPFVLEGETKVTLVFTYKTDMNLKEGKYNIKTKFSCEE